MTSQFHIPYVRYRFWLVSFSIIMVLGSFFIMAVRGFNYGIDFKGGAKLEYQFTTHRGEDEIRKALEPLGLKDINVVRFGPQAERRMSIKVALPEEHTKIAPQVTDALAKAFGEGAAKLEQEETVGPKAGQELRRNAWLAILFSWMLMLIYVGYRFDFLFAPGAIIALIHDVSIMFGFFALFGKEINLTIVAAALTLIGYSINDTIVIFDRIRENKHRITPATLLDVVNESLNSTLSRTLITSLTILFVVLVLFSFGGGTLHDFAFALIIGTIVGTYSSLFVATPIYIGLYRHWPKLSKRWKR